MAWRPAPALIAILRDADEVAPDRSHASDGTIGDPAHAASKSDHNPDFRGIVHACDITNDPAHGMDTWHWAQIVANRMVAGSETRVEYLVSNNGAVDVIFHPSVSRSWRQNGSAKQEHRNHLHVSIKYTEAAETDVRPFFVAVTPVPPPPSPQPVVRDEEDEMPLVSRISYGDRELHTFYVNAAGKLIQKRDLPNGGTQEFDVGLAAGVSGRFDPTRGVFTAIVADGDLLVGAFGIDGTFNDIRWDIQGSRWVQQVIDGQ